MRWDWVVFGWMGGPHLLRAPVWLGAALLLDIHREWVLKYSVIQYKECRSVILNIQLKHFLYCLKKKPTVTSSTVKSTQKTNTDM